MGTVDIIVMQVAEVMQVTVVRWVMQVTTVAEKGRAFYFQRFRIRPIPNMVVSDYDYFRLPKFLITVIY